MALHSPINPDGPADPLVSELVNDPEMAEPVRFFLDDLRDRVAALIEALERGDGDRLRRLSHELRGAAGGYGFPSITVEAAEVELALQAAPVNLRALHQRTLSLIAQCRRAIEPTLNPSP